MRYFIPDIRLAAELPPQTELQEKLGGLPWGLPQDRWPKCANCKRSQSLLAQFVHHRDRLDLGRDGRVLFVFQCNHEPGMCTTWEGGSGANACFVMEPEELTDSLPNIPQDQPLIEREARIVEWLEREDGIPESQVGSFFNDNDHLHLPEDTLKLVAQGTRLGSVPFWIQSAGEAPKDGWRFVGQLDSFYSFFSAPKVSDNLISPDPEKFEGRTHVCGGPNFGDSGFAYLFLRQTSGVPEGRFFWQCG